MKLKFTSIYFFALFLLIVNIEARGQTGDFSLRNNDRVVFYGDSITEQSFYTNFVETYVVTRFPRLNVSFINSGWSGDRIYGAGGGTAEERIRRDVIPHKPTVMTMMLGMNDGCYIEFNADCYKAYREGYERFLALLKKDLPGLRLTLLQPSPFDDWTDSHAWRLAPPVKGGYNNVLIRYSEFVKELAQKNKLNAADMNTALVDVIQKAQKTDRELAQKIIPDRIHPGEAGGLVMAAVLLKSWNAPSLVSSVEIDASGKKISNAEKSRLSESKFAGGISWTQIDDSLPLPIDAADKTQVLVANLANIVELLDRQLLKVNNLSVSRYQLKIDGETVGAFTKEQLAAGVNLAILPTPMLKQAMAVHALTGQHNRLHYVRWRELQVAFEKDNLADTVNVLKSLDAMEAELVQKQRALAQPKPHRFELIPQ